MLQSKKGLKKQKCLQHKKKKSYGASTEEWEKIKNNLYNNVKEIEILSLFSWRI